MSGMGFRGELHSSNLESPMSALGQKQTLKRFHPMSGLPPKADIRRSVRHVSFVPKADSCAAAIGLSLRQVLPDFRQQLTWAKRLRKVIVTVYLARVLLLAAERIRRNRDNLNRSVCGYPAVFSLSNANAPGPNAIT
jgi:hypothetical protein